MKKIFLTCFLFLMVQNLVFSDEVIDSKGFVVPCKVITVQEGFVEYLKDGNLYMFTREEQSPVFNDYVDLRRNLLKQDDVTRYSGSIVVKDMWSTIIQNESGQIDIPFYKVKSVGVYKPN